MNLMNPHISKHDSRQMEITLDFDMQCPDSEYQVALYFFIPYNMGITPYNYSIENFYKNFLTYQRIHTPQGIFSFDSNLRLEKASQFLLDPNSNLTGQVIQEVKLFACFLDNKIKQLREKIDSDQIQASYDGIDQFIKILNSFRQEYIHSFNEFSDQSVKECFNFVNEYLSNRITQIVTKKALSLENKEFKEGLISRLSSEIQYQKNPPFLVFNRHSSEQEKQYFSYRQSILKKHIFEVLYLQPPKDKKTVQLKNMIGMFGAALAASWAVLAEIQRIKMMSNPNDQFSHFPIIILGVIAYIFKDRIKEESKEILNHRLRNFIADFTEPLRYSYFNELGNKIFLHFGNITETIRFISYDKLPSLIKNLRKNENLRKYPEPKKNEVVIKYLKKVKIKNQKENPLNINSLKHVVRFKVDELLARLDSQSQDFIYFDEKSNPAEETSGRVYHVNIIIKLYKKSKKGIDCNHLRKRLVINKHGLLRIENIDTNI